MKKMTLILVGMVTGLFACQKNNNDTSAISLSASAITAKVGEQVTVTLSSSANASRWTVTPGAASQSYGVTTAKTNQFTFDAPGVYTIGVSAKQLDFNPSHESLDSCWNRNSWSRCPTRVDSASLKITVTP